MKIDFDLLLSKISTIFLTIVLKIYVFLIKNRILSVFFIIATGIIIFKDKKIAIITSIISLLFFILPLIIKKYLNKTEAKIIKRNDYIQEIIKMNDELLATDDPEKKLEIFKRIKEKEKNHPDKKDIKILKIVTGIILILLILIISCLLIKGFDAFIKLLIENRSK